jgi:hypothetical protein
MARIMIPKEAQQWLDRIVAERFPQDAKTVAERKWRSGLKPSKPQQPCDHGLFGDEHLQMDLVEMFQDPTNG